MSLPITAVGPLNVETNPILIVSAAAAGWASAKAATPASQNAVFIGVPPPRSSLSPSTDRRVLFLLCFVRETAPRRQARTDGSLFEPSDHAPMAMHHNSQATRKSRIIVQPAAIGFGYWPMGKAVLSAGHKGLHQGAKPFRNRGRT